MTARDAFEFVFGPDADLAAWDEADSDERRQIVAERFGIDDTWAALLRTFVVGQMCDGDPPEVWATARRLAAEGLGAERVLNQISIAHAQTMKEAFDAADGASETSFDSDAYRARLDRLPLPEPDEIERALLDTAAASVVTPVDELEGAAVRILHGDTPGGGPREGADGDQTVATLVDRVFDELVGGFGPLAFLPGDRVVHVASLCDGIVLTHRLDDTERSAGALTVAFDLAGFGHLDEPVLAAPGGDDVPLAPDSAEPGHLAWTGPDGWLAPYPAGTVLAVRRDPEGRVTFEPQPTEPAPDPDVVAAVRRAYDAAVAEPGLPVSGRDLLLGVLAEARADGRPMFTSPQAPLDAVCAAADLERRGTEVADDPAVWANDESARRSWRVLDQVDDRGLAEDVMRALAACDLIRHGAAADDATARQALDLLADLDVLSVAHDELVDAERVDPRTEILVERLLAAADSGPRRAVARLLAARHAEVQGDLAAAEQHLELAVEADAGFVPALDTLAWYAGDRGDATRAARLWRRCGPAPTVLQDLETVEPFARAGSLPGRNDPCWCGSGRKYKQCHLGQPATAPLPDRVGWLCRKAAGYLSRSGTRARAAVMSVADARAGDDGDIDRALDDPLVVDLVLTESGWLGRFLAERGALLPDDEAVLAASWAAVDRTVYEITDVDPGTGVTVRDLRTGDRIDVRERTFSHRARPAMLVCGRAVPDGATDGAGHQFVGGLVPVAPGTEATVLDMLDEGDPFEIAAWARESARPPELRTREGERIVQCEIVLTARDRDGLIRHLDRTYEVDVPGAWWTEHHDLDDIEAVVRARFHLDGDRLTVTTNSAERADRILGRLPDSLDVEVVSDDRTPLDAPTLAGSSPAGGRHRGLPDLRRLAPAPPSVPPPAPPGPDLGDAAIEEIQAQMEERWCTEPVPALGGRTPLDAVADPTRREEVERLLASFDALPVPPGGFTMRTDRLRARLGL